MAVRTTFPAVVTQIIEECRGVRTFRLESAGDFSGAARPSAFPGDFLPGQFVMVGFPEDPRRHRAYSIASSPLEAGYVEITLSQVGEFTRRMFLLAGGETLELSGPFGKWVYRDDARHAVLISGGTGITPFRSMIRYVLGKGLPNRLTLLYSARTPSDVIYRAELADYAGRGVRMHLTVSRPQEMEEGEAWEGGRGRLSMGILRELVPDRTEAHFYLCGPNSLVESFRAELAKDGVDAGRLHYEKWGDY